MRKKGSAVKKILILLILLGVVYFVFLNKEEKQSPGENEVINETIGEDTDKALFEEISNSTISVPDQNAEAELKDGYGEFQIEDTTVEGFVSLENTYTVVDKNGEKNFFGVASVSPSGSGIFQYLIWYKKSGKEISPVSSIFLGDRIAIGKISTKEVGKETEITLETLERKESDPMTEEPTIEKTRMFVTLNNVLVEK